MYSKYHLHQFYIQLLFGGLNIFYIIFIHVSHFTRNEKKHLIKF